LNEKTLQPDGILPGSGPWFDRIAGRYDLLNRLMSFGIDRRWRRKTVAALALADRPARILDLATGTADVALDIARAHHTATVVGIDPAARMLEIGRRKVESRGLGERIELVVGDAQALKFGDDEFDGATIAFGIRNVPDRAAALREMARVVRPGGRVCVLEMSEPRGGIMAAIARFHLHVVIPRLGALLSEARQYRFLQTSTESFPPPPEFAALMTSCGLDVVEVRPFTFGICQLYVATSRKNAR
jgi:demethylmenaquinone methyltransferase/2-methoxy-6-polyprenyl-1,4-benzoquinol methylase